MVDAAAVPLIKARLAILAGRGRFPVLVSTSAREIGHDPFIVAIDGEADQDWSGFDHCVLRIGDVAGLSALIRREKIGTLVLAGGIDRRPRIRDLRPTWQSLAAAPSLLRTLLSAGDDQMLRAAIGVLERQGVTVVGAQVVAPGLLGHAGPLGKLGPKPSDQADIAAAEQAALALGRLDVGQGAVAVGGRVIALEGLEGTDLMLERVAALRTAGRLPRSNGGVLVKMCKPDQDERADLPSIGPDTVTNAHAAGLNGIAIEAERALVLERDLLVAEADRLGLFVTGLRSDDKRRTQ
ncbi:UDP-2,3-diacylglucosamine diphosphatase LpxI [Hoeflea sp. G2-23]|uniref:UDP-2,3-diacylglucosamine diphosphatase LpxI n=1 Tax=Hoeflea algicola TaxID=2983763 RepID=A0ABT3Z4T9_9HYPH|nr:UDP-2,3-diacylglucosamine diphosphatase LpxI [Hoeflea algicola]MCY0146729.1 UDP-2,3-diacylglucosamine diphosphatase LpxI [Hoeflea algicola]